MREQNELARFEQIVLPHLDAAYNLARWLTRQDHDAQDVLQEALLRAYQFFGSFQGGDGRAWTLTIVRNTCFTWLKRHRGRDSTTTTFDEQVHSRADTAATPESQSMAREDCQFVQQAIEKLPPEFREIIVLRELEGLSYKEIANVAEIPLGTVMSRLARAREQLEQTLRAE